MPASSELRIITDKHSVRSVVYDPAPFILSSKFLIKDKRRGGALYKWRAGNNKLCEFHSKHLLCSSMKGAGFLAGRAARFEKWFFIMQLLLFLRVCLRMVLCHFYEWAFFNALLKIVYC